MPPKAHTNAISIARKVLDRITRPDNINELGDYIVRAVKECQLIALNGDMNGISPNQLGNFNGQWFEYFFHSVAEQYVGKDNITWSGRGHKISEITGFENVTHIPMPDIIVKNFTDLRAIISLKWSMRERWYQSAYEAYTVKDINPDIKAFFLTNDLDSGFRSNLKAASRVPKFDGVYHLQHNKLPNELKIVIKSFPQLLEDITNIIQERPSPNVLLPSPIQSDSVDVCIEVPDSPQSSHNSYTTTHSYYC